MQALERGVKKIVAEDRERNAGVQEQNASAVLFKSLTAHALEKTFRKSNIFEPK